MTRHKDSPEFIQYLQTVIPDLIAPIKTFTDKLQSEYIENPFGSKNLPSGYYEINKDFDELGIFFANLNENFSEMKAAFIWDIRLFFDPNFSPGYAISTNADIVKHLKYHINESVHLSTIFFLHYFDKENHTNLEFQAKTMFYKYAKAVCLADGVPLSKFQVEVLQNFENQLFDNDFYSNFFELPKPKEYRHKDSAEFIEYLKNTIADLVIPLEEIGREIDETDTKEETDFRASIITSLLDLRIPFSNADRKITESEAVFIADIEMFLNNEYDDKILPNKVYKEALYESVKLYEIFKSDNLISGNLLVPEAVMYLQLYDKWNGTDFATQAKLMFFRFANAIAKADGNICENEQILLSEYKDLLFNYVIDEKKDKEDENNHTISLKIGVTESKSLDELTVELNSLVGLDNVKNDVAQLVNFLKVQKMREEKGMTIQPLSRHLVFYGNPGTGKTTVARLLSQIYKSLGILSKGHLVETDRAGLVAGYVGQTALKVREVVGEAIGGVLFVDEAYALSTGGDNDFGREAIDTLLKMMEDNRDDLIVVVAGYTDKMSAFLQTNPGLRSRFNKYLEFEDYTPEQLVEIFELFCTNGGYKLHSSTHDDFIRLFSVLHETRDETFGNGRLARNLYEMTINNQANRIVSLPHVDDEILSAIEQTDIPRMTDLQSVR